MTRRLRVAACDNASSTRGRGSTSIRCPGNPSRIRAASAKGCIKTPHFELSVGKPRRLHLECVLADTFGDVGPAPIYVQNGDHASSRATEGTDRPCAYEVCSGGCRGLFSHAWLDTHCQGLTVSTVQPAGWTPSYGQTGRSGFPMWCARVQLVREFESVQFSRLCCGCL